jgi:hypothetical protein
MSPLSLCPTQHPPGPCAFKRAALKTGSLGLGVVLLLLPALLFAGCAVPVKVKGNGDNWYATARITRF